ncbi:MAG: hypothetical protein IJ353_07700 [Lachnospiraceae bacterium]|nr:hypothetical protein [Lachnospiraceae bacterium]
MSFITTMNLFLAICFVPILPVIYFTMLNERKPKNNLILSTTIPKEAWEDPRVLAITKKYTKKLTVTCILLALLYIPAFFMEYLSIIMTYVMLWVDALIIVPNIPYVRAVKAMRALKKENWYHPELVKVQVADTSLASVFEEKQSTYTFVNFLLPLLVSLIPLMFPLVVPVEGSLPALLIVILCNSSTILMCYYCYTVLRKKEDRVNSDVTLTAVLTRIRRYYWGKCWIYISWLSAAISFCALLLFVSEWAFIIALALFVTGILALVVGLELKIRKEQQRLNKEQPSEILMDEDDNWPYGIVCYNKNDKNLFVNSRVGFGVTVNFAHPAGKALDIFAVVMLLLLPFIGLFTVKEEFTEPTVVLTETVLEAHHTELEYSIPLDDIYAVSYLTEMPEASKTWGTNFPHLYKGKFTIKDTGKSALLCLDPYDTSFILIRTTDESYYLFGMEDSSELESIYTTLKNLN